jgi:hypothetical protein
VAELGRNMLGTFEDLGKTLKDVGTAMKDAYDYLGTRGGTQPNSFDSLVRSTKKATGSSDDESFTGWGNRMMRNVQRFQMSAFTFGVSPFRPLREGDEQRQREELSPRLSGFEDVSATYKRIAEASRLVGGPEQAKTPVEEILQKLVEIESSGLRLRDLPRGVLGR